jgi:hypothetical protein
MRGLIRFLVANFSLTFFAAGLLASGVALLRRPRPWTGAVVVEALFSRFLLFSIAIGYLYNFVVHVFFGEVSARFIGWPDSPFQREVGFASLGFALIGAFAVRGSFDMRAAAVAGSSCFLLGAAGGHVLEMVRSHNFAPGNAGPVFYTDLLLPTFGFSLLWLQHRFSRLRHRT